MSSRLHLRVLDGVGADIVSGRMPAGTILRAADVGERYDVSLPVAREALRVLQSFSLIRMTKKVGIEVLEEHLWNHLEPLVIRWSLESPERERFLRSLIELRAAVEPQAARFAAERGTLEAKAAVEDAAERMRLCAAGNDLEGYLSADVAFHRLIMEIGRNPHLRSLQPAVSEALSGRAGLGTTDSAISQDEVDLHIAVSRAVRDGIGAEAEQAMQHLLASVEERVSHQGAPYAEQNVGVEITSARKR